MKKLKYPVKLTFTQTGKKYFMKKYNKTAFTDKPIKEWVKRKWKDIIDKDRKTIG